MMAQEPITVQLRYLQTLLEIGSSNNSTIVFPIPIDLLTALKKTVLPEEVEMSRRRRRGGLVDRVLRKLGLRRPPEPTVFPDDLDPGVGVREPRRPRPSSSGGAVALELPPETDER